MLWTHAHSTFKKLKIKFYGYTFIPAIIISDQNVSTWSKGPMLTKCSGTNWWTARTFKIHSRISKFFFSYEFIQVSKDLKLSLTNRLMWIYLHSTKVLEALKLVLFLLQQNSKKELCVVFHQWLCIPHIAGN